MYTKKNTRVTFRSNRRPNFKRNNKELKILSKKLKQALGVGGSIKGEEIIIQGNYRDQLIQILTKMGHQVKRIGG